MSSHRPRRAFTLLEVSLVLLIVSVLAGIAMPRYAAAEARYRVARAADRIADDLAYASVLARTRSAEVKIHYDKGDQDDESVYWFEGVPDPDRPGTDYTVVLRETPYRVLLAEAPGDITFRIDGRPNDTRAFLVQSGGHSRTVTIYKETGEVTID